jgi:hypothetical protein
MASLPESPNMTELLLRASAQVSGTLTVRLRPLGLQVDEMRLLRALKAGDGRPMGELAEELVISGPTLTKMVDRMVSDNLVYRRRGHRGQGRPGRGPLPDRAGAELRRRSAAAPDAAPAARRDALGRRGAAKNTFTYLGPMG